MVPKHVQNRDGPIGKGLQPVEVVSDVASQHEQISLGCGSDHALARVSAPDELQMKITGNL
jgi:hypothetical protein